MGNRMHVHIKHEIEYGSEAFNWSAEEMESLLGDAGCDVLKDAANDDCSYCDWEIDENEFKRAIKRIARWTTKRIASYWKDDNTCFVGTDLDEFKKYILTSLRDFRDTGDHRSGFYHFSWF